MLAAPLSLGLPAVAQTQPAAALRIGSTPNDSYAEPFYAADRGFFQRDGFNADVEAFATGAGVTQALAGGAIDVGITNPISLANAAEHGVPFQFFAAAATYNPAEVTLCVAADSPYKTAKDLNGTTVGTTAIKDSNSLHIVAWVDQNGGDSTTLHLVELPFSAMAAALRRGTVSAVPIAEPALSAAIKEGGIRVLGHPMDVYGKHFMVGGWFCALRLHRGKCRINPASARNDLLDRGLGQRASGRDRRDPSEIRQDGPRHRAHDEPRSLRNGAHQRHAATLPRPRLQIHRHTLDRQLKASDLIAKV